MKPGDEGVLAKLREAAREAARSGEGALSALERLHHQQRSRAAQSPREPREEANDLSSGPGAGTDGRCPDRAPRK
jgi:hypothetical protein